ncbi:radical SAM protein, family [gut metagenome]|uniref:Radical SAM protein, family n=1 Tax=gut metagenome TaxID=749906 RepID=J9CQG1_9ZZZZ
MPTTARYTDFASFLARYFTGKVQKLSVNAGFTCPNRDGSVGRGGCTYCNNQSFNPDYCATEESVAQQLERGKSFFSRKYPNMQYLAYFQAYTNTYGELSHLKALYEEALAVEGVVGLVVGTRPDCMPDELLDYFAELHRRVFVLIEYGVETVHDSTLQRINRGHSFACSADAIRRTAERGIPVGAHMILGLPGEDRDAILEQPRLLSELPLSTLKLHQLQIVKGTAMAREFLHQPDDFHLYSAAEYAELVVDYLERLSPRIAVERFTSQSPKELLLAPDWGLKNYEFVERVRRSLHQRDSFQGKNFSCD